MMYPEIDPVAFQIGPLAVHWYGLMYVFGFAAAWLLGRYRAGAPHSPVTPSQVDDLVFYGALGVILGGKIGYTLFYNFSGFLADPLVLIRLWEGGMSFHGGLLGVTLAMVYFAWRNGTHLFDVADFVSPQIPLGLAAGRLGNFINGELWGRPADVPWAMVFPPLGDDARHPSQLYQMALEGLVLFVIVWCFSARPRPRLAVTGVFLSGYGAFRSLAEFFRMPDAHIGYLAFDWVTMGHLLSLPMLVIGIGMVVWAYRRGT